MKLLAIDTATEACSAALYDNGAIATQYTLAPRQHTELILPMIDALLAEAGLSPTALDALAFGRGPGAFTGVRIAAGVVQGLAMAADLPVAPVSTLATLAQAMITKSPQIACAIDARMGEVYWALYRSDGTIMRLVGEESVRPPATVARPSNRGWLGAGSGWQTYRTVLQQAMGDHLAGIEADRYPSAAAMCPLAIDAYQRGDTVSAANALPVYLRDQVTGQHR